MIIVLKFVKDKWVHQGAHTFIDIMDGFIKLKIGG
ncbi:hypothetical protein J2Z43_001443 [Clostridioides mangenotii]|uniref:Uncharacterized protein n=1 Tax=Metaclostridioides mangenotii TaxID=1540 RepID=A0ABS4EAT6_9FIRM|nr:hypothetical protein [Clostridioides mangenotii]